ncbi:hypothetical protein SM033_00009 [Vibrio phage vB_VpaM_sm033]|nr:hypothetical protein SM033_00009 [Vibrio phage vB_VpaM_sm033]
MRKLICRVIKAVREDRQTPSHGGWGTARLDERRKTCDRLQKELLTMEDIQLAVYADFAEFLYHLPQTSVPGSFHEQLEEIMEKRMYLLDAVRTCGMVQAFLHESSEAILFITAGKLKDIQEQYGVSDEQN